MLQLTYLNERSVVSNIFTNNIARLIIGTVATASIGGSGYYVYAQNKVEQAPVMVQEAVASTTPEPSADVIEVEPSPVVVVTPKPTPVPTPTPTMSPEDKQKLCDEKKAEAEAKFNEDYLNLAKFSLSDDVKKSIDDAVKAAKTECNNEPNCVRGKEEEIKTKYIDEPSKISWEQQLQLRKDYAGVIKKVKEQYCQ